MCCIQTRSFHVAAGLTVLLICRIPSSHALAADGQAPLPNVILCMADDQGYGDVGYYGHPVLKTPTLDKMAAAGLRFDRFYAAAPVCSPTRGSVLTGRHPNRFGCFKWGYPLRPQEVTVAEALKKAGYATGHFGKWHVGPVRAESPASPGNSGFDEWFSSPNFFDNNPLMSHNGRVVQTEGESSHVTVDAALEWIRRVAKEGTPFLAVVWFGSPHGPHIALEKYRAMYADQPRKVQDFYGEITAMDEAIGRLRDALRELNVAENTLFWYTSDNGALPVGSTRGLSGRKGKVLEGGLRVPAIIEWPARVPRPRVSDVPCGSVDIYPTLLDLAGVEIENQPPLDGVSLVPLIEGRMGARAKPLGFWDYPAPGIGTRSTQLLEQIAAERRGEDVERKPPFAFPDLGKITKKYPLDRFPGHAAWLDGSCKLHRIEGKDGKARYALHDLARDPKEENDLAASEPERTARMKKGLAEWQESVVRSLNGNDYSDK